MCGIIGLIENDDVVERLYRGLMCLQHRGQDAAGILTYNKNRFHSKKGLGLIKDVFKTYEDISSLKGNIGLAQVRYPTIGLGKTEDAQPFVVNYPYGIAVVHNGNLPNYSKVRDIIEKKHKRMLYSKNDVEAVLNIFAEALTQNIKKKLTFQNILKAVETVYDIVEGAYSVLMYIKGEGLVAFRDPYGIRPLVFGWNEEEFLPKYIFASESASLSILDYKNYRDVKAGEVIFIDEKKREVQAKVIEKYKNVPHTPCIFEWVYFARPDSIIDGVNVYRSRVFMGKYLAEQIRERDLDIDVVVPVPDSARDASIELARELGIKYREGLVKNRYIGRTFIMPGREKRRTSVRQKLMPIKDEIDGKNVLLVDDSIVRGNTSRNIVKMVREAGAKKVYFAAYSAPLTSPCFYGIDMQTRNEFIARNRDEKKVAKLIGADQVIYQKLEDMEKAVYKGNRNLKRFCNACFTGKYPTKEINSKLIKKIEKEREKDEKKIVND